MLLHEYFGPDGQLVRVLLGGGPGDAFWIAEGQERFELPDGAIPSAFARYGMPLEDSAVTVQAEFSLGELGTLSRFRFRPRVDVIARDYALLTAQDREPQCVLATHLAAVLLHLGRRAAELAP